MRGYALWELARGSATGFYLDYRQRPAIDWGITFAVRTRTTRAGITPSLRRAVQAVDPNLPLIDVRTQEEQIATLLMNERVFADLDERFRRSRAGAGLHWDLWADGVHGVAAHE